MSIFDFLEKVTSPIDDLGIIADLVKTSKLKPSNLLKLQDKKIAELIRFSYNNVPYYHKLFKKNGLTPDDIKGTKDLHKVPILTKEKLRSIEPKDLIPVNSDVSDFFLRQTSGTTGIPLHIHRDKKSINMGYFQEYFWQLSCGNKVNYKQTNIASGWIPQKHAFHKIGFFRAQYVSAYTSLEKKIQQIRDYKPKTIISITSHLALIAKVIKNENINGINPDLIFTGGELLDSQTRNILQRTFGADVFDGYGANEVGGIAKECIDHLGFHVWGDSNYVEVIRDGEAVATGEEGEITVTNLVNRGTVLIRYNLEDIGEIVEENCSCGNHFPLLKLTGGRKIDYLYLPNGQPVSAVLFYKHLIPVAGILQFQMIQEETDQLLIKVVKGKNFTDNSIVEIQSSLKEKLGDVKVNVEIVDQIKDPKNQKIRQFINKLA